MTESIKKVSNPLTIIAIFAGLAETYGTVAIRLVQPDLQPIFIWFVILFPTLLIILFFLTLNFNPKVIYAPSDFKDEENFLKTINSKLYLNKLNYKVTSTDNNIEQVKETIKEVVKRSEEVTNSFTLNTEKEILNKANSFFDILLEDTQPLFDEKKLEELDFSIHSTEFFLLSFLISKDKLKSMNVDRYSFIIRIKIETERQISLEAIGQGIKETDYKIFANKLSLIIRNIVNSSTGY